MFKIKIINYKPYEYKILSDKLNELGQQGYYCQTLSFISFFKKTNTKYKYLIDFYTPIEKSRTKQREEISQFSSSYKEKDFLPIYIKNDMFVFVGKDDDQKQKDLLKNETYEPHYLKELFHLIISFFLLTLFIKYYNSLTIDSFDTYGMTFFYLGVFLLFARAIYRSLSNIFYIQKLREKETYDEKNLSIVRFVFNTLTCLSFIFVVGGLIEDLVNPKAIDPASHKILMIDTLTDSDIESISFMKKSSFTVKSTYISLQEATDGSSMYIKEYQFRNKETAKEYFQFLQENKQTYYAQNVSYDDSAIFGYYNNQLIELIILKENIIYMHSFGFEANDTEVQTILDFYE